MKLNVKILDPNAKLPTYGSNYAAGLDLYSCCNYTIKPGSRECVSTGIALEWESTCELTCELTYESTCKSTCESTCESTNKPDENPKNYYLRIAPRSGLSLKNGINVMAGVIDYDYRGEIKVILSNTSDKDFVIEQGDKIAQAILTRILRFDEISITGELNNTCRGMGGFGSTGIK